MANSYLQFSLLVPLKSEAELRWVAKTLASITKLFDDGELDERRARALGPLGKRIIAEAWDAFDAQWSLEPTRNDAEGVAALWIYAEEAGQPEHVAAVLEAFLQKFRPTGVITFSWAYTCSKLRPGEFGGGAALVTADGTKMLDAQSWAEDLAAKFVNATPETTP